MSQTNIEFYQKGSPGHIAVLRNVGAVPREGERININKQTWKVDRVDWAVDHSQSPFEREKILRANIELVPWP